MLTYVMAAAIVAQSPGSASPLEVAPTALQTSLRTNPSQEAATWSNAEVTAYLRAFGPDRTGPADPFAVPPLPGENIVLSFPIPAQMGELETYWTYDLKGQTMTVVATEDESATGRALIVDSPPQTQLNMRGWALGARRGPPTMDFVGNRQIPVRTIQVMGFGQVQASRVLGSSAEPREFRHTFSIEPDAARALSSHLQLQVSGKARPWRDGQWTLCVHDLSKMQSGIRVRSCYLTGVLETYRIIDKRDGSVIHEWDPS